MKMYCGVDMGKRGSRYCILDEQGRVQAECGLENEMPQILEFLRPYGPELSIVFESSNFWYWFVDGLSEAGFRDLTMAHSLSLAHIVKARVKSDRIDARKLAELHRVGFIPKGTIVAREQRSLRDLARFRQDLVQKRAGEFRQLRLHLDRNAVGWSPERSEIGRLEENPEVLVELAGRDPSLALIARNTLTRVRQLSEQVKEVEDALVAALGQRPELLRLLELPGVGKALSTLILLESGDMARFPSAKHYCAYCRVAPGIAQSGNSRFRSRGAKQGNPLLKSAFSQAAVGALRCYPEVKALYEAHKARRSGRGGVMVSINIIAHKLAQAAYHVLRGGRFEMDRAFSVERLGNPA